MTMRYEYPATLEPEHGGHVTLYFEGLPGVTWGETEEQALEHAKDLLATAVEMLIEDGEPLPAPPPAFGRPIISTVLKPSR